MSVTDPYAAPEEPEAIEANPEVVEANLEAEKAAEEVPEGSIKDVLAWVGTDATKAQAALDAENKASDPRSSLISKLEAITN